MKHNKRLVKWLATLSALCVMVVCCFTLAIVNMHGAVADTSSDSVKAVNLSMNASVNGYITTEDYFDLTNGNPELIMEFSLNSADTFVGGNYGIGVTVDYGDAKTNGQHYWYGADTSVLCGYGSSFAPGYKVRIIMSNEKITFTADKGTGFKWISELDVATKTKWDISHIRLGLSSGNKSVYNLSDFRIYFNGVAQDLEWYFKNSDTNIATVTEVELPEDTLYRNINLLTGGTGYITTFEMVDFTNPGAEIVMDFEITQWNNSNNTYGLAVNWGQTTAGLNYFYGGDDLSGLLTTANMGAGYGFRIIMSADRITMGRRLISSASNEYFWLKSYEIKSSWDMTQARLGIQTNNINEFKNVKIYVNGRLAPLQISGDYLKTGAVLTENAVNNSVINREIDLNWNKAGKYGYITSLEKLDMTKKGQTMEIEWTTVGTWSAGAYNTVTFLTWTALAQSPSAAGRLCASDTYAAAGALGNGKLDGADAIGNGYVTKYVLSNEFDGETLSKILVSAFIKPVGSQTWYARKVYDVTDRAVTQTGLAIGLQMYTDTVYNFKDLSVTVNGRKAPIDMGTNITNWSDYVTNSEVDATTPVREEGASIRVSQYVNARGLRFESTFNRAEMDALLALEGNGNVKKVSYGTLITAYDLLTESVDFTFDSMDANEVKYLDVVASGFYEERTTATTYTIYASIVNLKSYNYDREFAARSYVKIEYLDGRVEFIYSDFSEEDDVRSASGVATEAYNDRRQEESAVYCYYVEEDQNWSCYAPEALKIFKSYMTEGK